MEIEDRLKNLEWRLRYHKVMINVLALLVLASAGSRVWEQFSGPGEMTVTKLTVVNDEEKPLVALSPLPSGNGGAVATYSPEGTRLVALGANTDGNGWGWTSSPEGKLLVTLSATADGEGVVGTFSPEGKQLVTLGATNGNGGVWTTTKSGRTNRLD